MCGICGIFDFTGSPVNRDLVRDMSLSLQHRGPDGEGYYFGNGIGLAHRRLSIIDLAGGAQPIGNEDGSLQIIFNGEIYNYRELRGELLRKGHIFKTNSDTEVIIHGYEEWGLECLNRLNGIFAFALWDTQRKQLLLARDHLGVKPLYYTILGNRLLFASEIKALLRDSSCPREVDVQALSQLFTLRYVPSPGTLFRGIYKLPPASSMVVTSDGIKIARYWSWKPEIQDVADEPSLIETYRYLMEDAVRLQMRSDVPVGLFLSSGIDSGALLALMSRHASGPVRTFTIGFENGEKSNETDDARELARRFGADHTEMIIGPDDYLDYYQRYLFDLEEPVGNETAAAFYFVSHMAHKKVKVALCGQGADEPWAGYPRYVGAQLSQIYSRMPRMVTDHMIRPAVNSIARDERLRRGVAALSEPDMLTRIVKIYSFYTAEMKSQLFQPWVLDQVSADGREARERLKALQGDVAQLDAVSQMTYIDTRANLPDDLLMVSDKTAMANSLEARVPYLDYRMVEFAETLPSQMKLRRGHGKYLHKKAIEKWLPREIVYRPKKGFANPVNVWLRKQMRHFIGDCLLSEQSAVRDYFDSGYIQKLITEHENHTHNHLRHIYLLISFEMWHRQFIAS